jgi:general stress protein 26
MANVAKREDGIAKIRELIEDIEFAMLTTVCRDGSLRSRPMATMKVKFDGNLWFFTRADSPKVGEVDEDQHVNVAYAAPDDDVWVSLQGTATLSRDRAKMEELWNPHLEAYFPEGLDDPEIALLRVKVEKGEYWEAPGSIAYALEVATAIVTGERADPGENEKVDLK